MNAVLTSSRLVRAILLSLVLSVVLGISTYVGLRLAATHQSQADIAVLKARTITYETRVDAEHAALWAEVSDLRRVIVGDILPETEKRTTPPRPWTAAQEARLRELEAELRNFRRWKVEYERWRQQYDKSRK